MGEMVDRVARAIYEEGLVRARMVDHTHEAVLAVARAAIAAMRERPRRCWSAPGAPRTMRIATTSLRTPGAR